MSVCLCFSLKSSLIDNIQSDTLEKEYQSVYKPTAKFLYSHQNFCMSFSFNGPQLDFYKKKHPEFIELIQQLIERKQIEILGGGYYDPVFPLLFPRDRTGQIELLSSLIRESTGKRPRGISICASIWDSSLLSCFSTCGMEYILLDDSLISPEKNKYIPLIMSDKGKAIEILPIENTFKPLPNIQISSYFDFIYSKILKTQKGEDTRFLNSKKGISVQFSHKEFKNLLDSGWFDNLYKVISNEENQKISLSTPSMYLKESSARVPVFIAAGMSKEIAQWASKPYESVKVNKSFPVTIFDFIQLYPQSRALYDRMQYISMLVNQSHGDKIRRKVARDRLWESQNGNSFICTSKGAFVNSTYRQNSYKNLVYSEKILRECDEFKESISCFDYNGDGLNEYIIRMQDYFAIVNLIGGSIRELDVMQASGNYADNLSRVIEFENCNDDYERGLFIDHIFTEEQFTDYLLNKPSGNGIFSKMNYSELNFSSQHKDIQLTVSADYKNRQKVSLRKKFVATSSGLMIQYIIKNESSRLLKAKFAVESSFAQTNFNAQNFNAYKLEIITNGQKQEVDTTSSSKILNTSGKLTNVEAFQLTDTDNSISFTFEPNESCGLSFFPIVFNRPEYTTGENVPASMTFANTLFWDINLEPGMEMEKTINFSIFNMHKKRKSIKK